MKRRIYYYDTDCGGVVYYGNYMKFLEEARTEYMEARGLSVKALMDGGVWFVVKRQEIEYKAPAVYGDVVETRTWVNETSAIRVQFAYEIKNQDGKIISKAVTDMVCVGPDFKIKEMPSDVRTRLQG
ncbi:MAG: hypothetical protein A2X34_07005 [Elusimicrobia bacterium GWC2_51_8]|nr:MAG: hypothetical protein A2X33_06295 [Elusimicrobia bacterium GWA2_51_34]OGR61076.1 MAG: hypothetical protein A2X34_07005 [Elusimicrobia bacterium GWC2_51_8]OGR87899.1 MAG: hypothetical protein A2021_05990 [Elusimicrobia bacterium GWF2_52_66]HAF95716.1 acyl-CoA thioesterase [Elusimicrobiota bacterium]HCE97039.1 acyl-CoA thioesterase [Elusimicrobiota bacterium]